ncbi:zinc finger protein [Aphelenchoides avenae]|nr:zinc finger protein [Aphelenchus avenae]
MHAEKKHACQHCDKSFGSEQLLRVHLRRAHAKEKKYACKQCRFQAVFPIDLHRHHERVHTAKTLACGSCGQKFGGPKTLEAHAKLVHDPKKTHAPNSLKCDQCEKLFTTEHFLKMHAYTHKRIYSCDKCSRQFSSVAHLEDHVSSVHDKKK